MVQTADQSNQPLFEEYISPTQWPWSLQLMVSEARRILSYIQNLPKKAMPPKSIWHSSTKCAEFIETNMNPDNLNKQTFLEFEEPEIQ
jgi:hypothetical protein